VPAILFHRLLCKIHLLYLNINIKYENILSPQLYLYLLSLVSFLLTAVKRLSLRGEAQTEPTEGDRNDVWGCGSGLAGDLSVANRILATLDSAKGA
jgi:hypothetical protein